MPVASSTIVETSKTDRECLEAWRHCPSAESLRPWVERYGAFVYSSAYRRTGRADHAEEVTRAVFLVLARRARKLRKKTVLAGWLFHVTAVAWRKLAGKSPGKSWKRWFGRRPKSEVSADAPLWARVAPQIDSAIERLSVAQRDAVLLRVLLNRDWESVARTLCVRDRRAGKRVERGLKKITRRLRHRGMAADVEALARVCSAEGCALPLPEGLAPDILKSLQESRSNHPSFKLARRTLNALAWARWRRRFVLATPMFGFLLAIIGGIFWYIDSLSGHSGLISELVLWSVRYRAMRVAEPARPWPTNAATARLDASLVRNAHDLYQTTNIWLADLKFTSEQWKALEPKRIGPMSNFVRPDGMWLLRNPKARRSGVVGVLGFEFDWTHADLEFGSVAFTNVAARVKGNIRSLSEPNRAYKVDLNKFAKGQKLGGLDDLMFNSLVWDYSCLGEALGFEFFRDAGVPAPRTAYAWLSASVATHWARKPLGLYLMIEPVDNHFAAEQLGSKSTGVFKPVTYNLFEHLGDDWSAYAPIYDSKTKTTPEQQRRVIEFARLVSSATDAQFAAQVGGFLDLDEFSRFLAGEVLLSNYDSILADGQNFYLYLDPRSNKFGFIPWDLDAAWGNFWLASMGEFERASIWHPWAGDNRFIERVMAVDEFRRIYRAHLEDFLTRLFVPDRLNRRIDEIAAVIHDPIAAESAFLLDKFEQAVGRKPVTPSPRERPNGINRPAYELKSFIDKRAESVRRQLDGKSKGMILNYPARK